MIAKKIRKSFVVLLSFVFALTSSQILYGFQDSGAAPAANSGAPTEGAPLTDTELQSLVAPIALYPDALVAQILTASTFPDQVAIAEYWMTQNTSLTGSALMQAVDKQSWDPSVKALTQFPSVLANLAHNLTWTSSLGEAFHNQQAEVMTAVQALRAKAQAAGNLKSTSQVTVVQQSPQVIVIQPANPQVVYVPEYNPAVIYGTPYVTPGYTAGDVAAAGDYWVRRRNCRRSHDERWMLRLGLQQLELRVAWHGGGLPRRGVLRKHRMARRLLQRWLPQQLRLQQRL